jgi:hypothetical protein
MGFNPAFKGLIYMGFAVCKVGQGKALLWALWFSLPILIPPGTSIVGPF